MRNLLTVFFALCTLNTITVSARPAFDYSALRDGTFEQKTVSGVRSLSERRALHDDERRPRAMLLVPHRRAGGRPVRRFGRRAPDRIYGLRPERGRKTVAADHGRRADLPAFVYRRVLDLRQAGRIAAATFAGRAAAAGAVFARRQPGGFRARRQPVRRRSGGRIGAAADLRRPVQPYYQRLARLGLRGGVFVRAGVRLVARRQEDSLPAVRREPREAV